MRAAAAAFTQGFRRSSSTPNLAGDSRDLVLPPGRQSSDKEVDKLYEKGEKIGSGRGEIFKAVEVESGEPCALKIIVRSNLNPNLLASLRNESTITSSFGIQPHVNLCVPIKVHETRSKIVVEMDLVEGGDLMDFLTQTPSLKWLDQMQPLRLLPQIFRGVEYLHRNRVIHGDLKPENILLTRRPGMKLRPGDSLAAAPGCMYKICDFGNSVVVPEEAEVVTLGGKKVGTPGYASPEAWNGEAIGFESDMWSLGILVYVIFTGELPYEPTDEEATAAFYADPKKSFKQLPKWKRMSRGVRKLISSMVVANRAERITIEDALEAECLPGRNL
ncbi:hypothetical protein TrST_g1031 [Triparma strigata]|uniref:Protein kinase domain-containing protein n=1 Tax=Triparma strigata TaxID=1606541 RepID=A0A9W6ZSD9_9STRA|nr:hypothetical protein TrST_g1031 [Triparma strigata]